MKNTCSCPLKLSGQKSKNRWNPSLSRTDTQEDHELPNNSDWITHFSLIYTQNLPLEIELDLFIQASHVYKVSLCSMHQLWFFLPIAIPRDRLSLCTDLGNDDQWSRSLVRFVALRNLVLRYCFISLICNTMKLDWWDSNLSQLWHLNI